MTKRRIVFIVIAISIIGVLAFFNGNQLGIPVTVDAASTTSSDANPSTS